MLSSMLKTLAAKHRSTAIKITAKHQAKIMTPYGPRTCFEAIVERGKASKPLVARFGGVPLTGRRRQSSMTSCPNASPTHAES
jgi:hypothetical protein